MEIKSCFIINYKKAPNDGIDAARFTQLNKAGVTALASDDLLDRRLD